MCVSAKIFTKIKKLPFLDVLTHMTLSKSLIWTELSFSAYTSYSKTEQKENCLELFSHL